MGFPFLALPGFVAADAGIAIATPSAAMARPRATRRTTLVWSIPFLPFKKDRDFASTIRMAQRFDNEDFRDSTMRFSEATLASDWAIESAGTGGEGEVWRSQPSLRRSSRGAAASRS